jgi:phosphate butyryltransferase
MKSINEVFQKIKGMRPKKIAVAAAADPEVLSAVNQARQIGIAEAVLFGDPRKIEGMMRAHDMDVTLFELVAAADDATAAAQAVKYVSEGQADLIMKGLLETAPFMKAVLSPEGNLRKEGQVISSIAVTEIEAENRLIFITDPGFIPLPDLATKKKIIENAVAVLHALGIPEPKVAALSAMETVSPKITSSVEARELQEMNRRGEITGCVVAGPISLDLAVSEKAVRHKCYTHPVGGKADILLVPSLEVGNVLYKSMAFFAHVKSGGIVTGARAPIIFTSRADSIETKLNTIAFNVLLANGGKRYARTISNPGD